MSRSSFILAATLFVVAATMVFISSFDRANERSQPVSVGDPIDKLNALHGSARESTPRTRVRSSRDNDNNLSVEKSATKHLNFEELVRVDQILSRIERDSQEQLDQYSRNYGLTGKQQREIFPVLVAYHDQTHPSIKVNGQTIPSVNLDYNLEQTISSFLDSSQREAFLEDAADHEAWWIEVVGQLENDLDTAISNGEMVPAENLSPGLRIATESAVGDGGSSGHSGGNLFDLLAQ
ncbi:MAG TPA: hypothetical protein DDW37_04525 [Verrucomicrobiales bacterium]|nr:hypothetical protein [Verrucomicrobiales bacterium]